MTWVSNTHKHNLYIHTYTHPHTYTHTWNTCEGFFHMKIKSVSFYTLLHFLHFYIFLYIFIFLFFHREANRAGYGARTSRIQWHLPSKIYSLFCIVSTFFFPHILLNICSLWNFCVVHSSCLLYLSLTFFFIFPLIFLWSLSFSFLISFFLYWWFSSGYYYYI